MFDWLKTREIKVEPRAGRKIYIPEAHIVKVLSLSDTVRKEDSALSKYRLWEFIGEIVPETLETPKWSLLWTENILTPYVIERLK